MAEITCTRMTIKDILDIGSTFDKEKLAALAKQGRITSQTCPAGQSESRANLERAVVGAPLPVADPPFITDKDLEEAVAWWRKLVPARYRNLLDAKVEEA